MKKMAIPGKSYPLKKNVLLLEQNATKLAAVQHENGEDYWLVTHGFGPTRGGGSYFSFPILKDSISLEPVESSVGVVQQGDINTNNNVGYLKISPDGTKTALVLPEDGIVEVADFNTTTGMVSNVVSSSFERYNYPLGVEFSANSKLLYVTTNPPKDNSPNKLYQFDLDQIDLENPPIEIASFDQSEGRQLAHYNLQLMGVFMLVFFGNPYQLTTSCR